MPRPADHAKHVALAVGGLLAAVTGLVVAVKAAASRDGGSQPGGDGKTASTRGAKLKQSLKSYWARLTPAQHKAKIRKMLAARGLKPKPKKSPTARGTAITKALKASWARYTPAQHAARVRKMLAARGLEPRAR